MRLCLHYGSLESMRISLNIRWIFMSIPLPFQPESLISLGQPPAPRWSSPGWTPRRWLSRTPFPSPLPPPSGSAARTSSSWTSVRWRTLHFKNYRVSRNIGPGVIFSSLRVDFKKMSTQYTAVGKLMEKQYLCHLSSSKCLTWGLQNRKTLDHLVKNAWDMKI